MLNKTEASLSSTKYKESLTSWRNVTLLTDV